MEHSLNKLNTANIHRFLVFGFNDYYSKGGWNDFIASIEKIEDILDLFPLNQFDNYQIIDILSFEVVKEIKIK